MSGEPHNPPAFPQSCTSDGYTANVYQGMTLRDHFAAAALTGMLSDIATPDIRKWRKDRFVNHTWVELCAEQAYIFANAMLAARRKE
jgi:hypothetical protein